MHEAFLISKETSPGVCERDQRKPLEMIKYLVEEGANVNAGTSYFPPPLQQSIALNDIETVKYLLHNDVEVNRIWDFPNSKHRMTALGTSILKQNLAIVKLLITYGADPSIGSYGDKTFLEYAKEQGNKEIFDALLLR